MDEHDTVNTSEFGADGPDTQASGTNSNDVGQQLAAAKAEAEQNLAGWKRAQADFENFRKRTESESAEWVMFGKHAAFVQIVPILDSLEQALVHAPELKDEKYEQWKTGLDGIVGQIEQNMRQLGIEKINAIGSNFDPNIHEAVREVPGEQDGLVAEQYQTGYTLNGKLLRPAQVAITKKQT